MKYKSFPLPSFDAAFAIFVTLVAVMGVFFILISTFWTRRQSNGMFKREILCKIVLSLLLVAGSAIAASGWALKRLYKDTKKQNTSAEHAGAFFLLFLGFTLMLCGCPCLFFTVHKQHWLTWVALKHVTWYHWADTHQCWLQDSQ